MAPPKKFYKKKSKKSYKKKAPIKKLTLNKPMVNMGQGFPKKMLMTHKYSKNLTLISTLGSVASYTFSCNGLYDPDNTSLLGNQPLFFDQASAIYQHYCCIASKITVKVMPAYANQPAFGFAMFLNDDTTISIPSLEAIKEQTTGTVLYVPGGGDKTASCVKKWSAKKTFGGAVLANTDLQGTITSNPNEQTHYSMIVQPLDFTTNLTVFVQVYIEYIAIWKEMRDIERS